jgi:PTS system mannose-specific IID component/fructoselysine and glucoselysine-specific PTS system IID component
MGKVTKRDLWKVFINQLAIRGANNYERQQNAGFTQSMMPIIEKLYTDPEDKREAYSRHMEYFLTQDMVSAIPVGISTALEEENSKNEEFNPAVVNATKMALMGPLASLGDSLLNGTARPILASLAISFVTAGLGWIGPIFFVIGMSIISLGIRYLGVFEGYNQGTKFVELLAESDILDEITDMASIAAYMLVGGFIPGLVVVTTPITVGEGESVLVLQDVLNDLMPGLLGLIYTGIMYYLVQKKKVSATWLLFGTMLVGIVGVYIGVLG